MLISGKTHLQNGWDVIVVRSTEEIENIRAAWEEMQRNEPFPTPNADITRYLSVIDSSSEKVQPYIIVLFHNSQPQAMLIGRIQRTKMPCQIGYKTLFKPSLCSVRIVYGGIIGQPNSEISAMLLVELNNTLRNGEADVISFNNLKIDSPVYKAAKKLPSFLCREHFSKRSPHNRMAIPKTIDQFYESCSKKHRGNLRRYLKKLESQYQGQVKVVMYSSEEELEESIKAMSAVSANTYQYALGCGFVDNARTRSLMRTAAKSGWLRTAMLFIGEKPCAFQVGLQYRRTYFLEQIGFDPSWKKFEVGTVLFLKVLERLCGDPTVDSLDFGFGDAQYKKQYGDERWIESSIQIFAPRTYPVFINILCSSIQWLNSGLEYVLKKTAFTAWIKQRWRNFATKKCSHSNR